METEIIGYIISMYLGSFFTPPRQRSLASINIRDLRARRRESWWSLAVSPLPQQPQGSPSFPTKPVPTAGRKLEGGGAETRLHHPEASSLRARREVSLSLRAAGVGTLK